MIRLRMAKERRSLIEKMFPLEGVGWQLPSIVAAIVGIAVVGGAAWVWFREQSEDVLTAEIPVWAILMSVGEFLAVVFGVLAVLAGAGRRLTIGAVETTFTNPNAARPREIDHFGVKWPIDWPRGYGVYVGKPTCPKDRSTLGYVIELKDSEGDVEFREVAPLPDKWETLGKQLLYFECFKDGSTYDLRRYGHTMADACKEIEGLAWGEYRTAQVKGLV